MTVRKGGLGRGLDAMISETHRSREQQQPQQRKQLLPRKKKRILCLK